MLVRVRRPDFLRHQVEFQCPVPARLVRPVLQVGQVHPVRLAGERRELPRPERPERPERLELPGPAQPPVHWRYCPYPAPGCFDCNLPKRPSPRKR